MGELTTPSERKLRQALEFEGITDEVAFSAIGLLRHLLRAWPQEVPDQPVLQEARDFIKRVDANAVASLDEAIRRLTGAEAGNLHRGDPCEFCGTPHDDVAVGDCPGYPAGGEGRRSL